MNMLTLFILVAVVASIFALVSGISAMAHDNEVSHEASARWMTWRVAFKAGAIALILLAMLGSRSGMH